MSSANTNSQCNNCNLIVNEMLTFVQSKIGTMDPETLVKVCSTVFSYDDIDKAKSILSNFSNVQVKGDDLYAIIEILKSLDGETCPVFVARDLNKLPVATVSSHLLKENYKLEKEMQLLKSNMVSVDNLLSQVVKIAGGQKVYIAKYGYDANEKNEVSFRKGDLISDVYGTDENWMSGQVLRTGRVGMLPANYVDECTPGYHHFI